MGRETHELNLYTSNEQVRKHLFGYKTQSLTSIQAPTLYHLSGRHTNTQYLAFPLHAHRRISSIDQPGAPYIHIYLGFAPPNNGTQPGTSDVPEIRSTRRSTSSGTYSAHGNAGTGGRLVWALPVRQKLDREISTIEVKCKVENYCRVPCTMHLSDGRTAEPRASK